MAPATRDVPCVRSVAGAAAPREGPPANHAGSTLSGVAATTTGDGRRANTAHCAHGHDSAESSRLRFFARQRVVYPHQGAKKSTGLAPVGDHPGLSALACHPGLSFPGTPLLLFASI